MTKDVFDKTLVAAKANGINSYAIRCENGNRIMRHNPITDEQRKNGETQTGFIKEDTDSLISVELSGNYAVEGTIFNITSVTFDTIDSIIIQDVDYSTSMAIAKSLGIWDDDMKTFFEHVPVRRDLKPGTAGLAIRTDTDGKPVLAKGSVGYVTQ